MDKTSAARLIQNVFQNPFDRDLFVTFTKNLFNFLDTEKNFVYRGNFIPDACKPFINTLERIGKYEDVEENKIDVLIVHLKKEHSIEHARTMQRNFIAWYLGGSRGGELKDAALVAFYTDNPDDWRFSLVKMDYQIVESSTGKIKTKTELTPARRFSFLVGKNENSHTAQRQLLPTLQDDKNNPLLSDLEKAFNIEVVTQEFFEKYKSLFLDVKDSLDRLMKKDPAIAKDFAEKAVDPVDFSKKLLGQIVFLYFLQKKGWFGVERDSNWGTGPKNFLRLLFEKMIADYKNFFNDILEPLFYEALAKERDDDFYSRFNCKIPFLNGGLFDPLSDYDWVHTDILLPDELFSNQIRTKEGDTGTGILDIFDRYNFTVKEDEPLEKEVAVDPEMLGKVFENLLEVKDRKSKGTYYTPREIVHYMCQESLINYLVNECEGKVGRTNIETLIQYGETAVEHDSRVEQEGKETETYSYKLPESVRKNAQFLDDKLKNIRVCDPAIGSGAFPVGMMNEIIRTRNTLTNYLEDKADRSIYIFKRDAIQNSLYGVDIDPGAVEIAKLRLWLSLVVDEEDIKQIKPLPNLDYKIMQGNSLLEEFEGVQLFDEELISKPSLDDDEQIEDLKKRRDKLQHEYIQLHSAGKLTKLKKSELDLELKKLADLLKHLSRPKKAKSESTGLFDVFSEAKKKAQELKQLHKEFFEASQKNKKDELKKRIENLEWELIETTLREQNKLSALKQLEQYKRTNIKPFFLWRLHFAEVFQEKGGFDIVIGNPPYVRVEKISEAEVRQFKKDYLSSTGKFDLYFLFFEVSISRLLNRIGLLSFICSYQFLYANSGIGLRKFLIENTSTDLMMFSSSEQVFNSATTYTGVFIASKSQKPKFTIYSASFDDSRSIMLSNKIELSKDHMYSSKVIISNSSILDEINNSGKFVPCSFIGSAKCGVVTSADDIFYLSKETVDVNSLEKEIILPIYSPDDLDRFTLSKPKVYCIYPYDNKEGSTELIDLEFMKKQYNNLYRYFIKNKTALTKRSQGRKDYAESAKWYQLNRPREKWIFDSRKLIYAGTANKPVFALDDRAYLFRNARLYGFILNQINNTTYKYLLGIFNSKLAAYFASIVCPPKSHGYCEFSTSFVESFPIPRKPLDVTQLQEPIADLVNKVILLKSKDSNTDTAELEKQIDQLIYKLYDLTPEEIEIIDGKS